MYLHSYHYAHVAGPLAHWEDLTLQNPRIHQRNSAKDRMALSLAVRAAQPILRLVHAPDRHLRLGPTVNWPLTLHLCCVPPRSPRQRRTSWPTVKLMCGRTLSSSQCLRQKTPSERRSSFVPSSDSICYENVSFSVCEIPGRDRACS